MRVTICASIAFLNEMLDIKKQLEQLGHEVKMPPVEVEDGKGNLISATDYYKIRRQTTSNEDWVWDRKEWAMKEHFNKVAWSDTILVLNYDKNNVKGYVGANTFLEMGLALHLGKKIFMINPIPEVPHKEELLGMKPIILNGNLKLIDALKIGVGSHNPVKLKAVEMAFKKVWPNKEWIVMDSDVESGVADQPMSDEESIKGAKNRAKQAIEKTGADYGVGLEGGLQKIGDNYFDGGWIVVRDKQGDEGIGSTLRMPVSEKMIDMINQGMELGTVDDIIFNKSNCKQAEGHFGLMTNNAVTRTKGYVDGVISALSRFIHPEIFEFDKNKSIKIVGERVSHN